MYSFEIQDTKEHYEKLIPHFIFKFILVQFSHLMIDFQENCDNNFNNKYFYEL